MSPREVSASKPSVVVVIPARGGSRRIPGKNLLPICGKPLLAYSLEHALGTTLVDEVVVSTDDNDIAALATQYGVSVVRRPRDLSGDEATSESALIHALDSRRSEGLEDPAVLVFLQCTSPLREADDIDRAIRAFTEQKVDSLFSACRNNRLYWAVGKNGPYALNYDFEKRQREQEMDPQYNENGSIYVLKPSILRANKNRLGGKIGVSEMSVWNSFQVDEATDVEMIEWIISRKERSKERVRDGLELLIFDFDGVFTDNRVAVDQNGLETVSCHRGDSLGLSYLRKTGFPMMVLSTEANEVVAARCRKLQIPCHQGVEDKGPYLEAHLSREGIDAKNVAYVGNDINDLDCLKMVGLAVVVADSHPDVIEVADLVLKNKGGQGAVREICDMVRMSRGKGARVE